MIEEPKCLRCGHPLDHDAKELEDRQYECPRCGWWITQKLLDRLDREPKSP
jgi:DNA-directed RNA polymerase subunit RPC12/RpoP